MEVPVLAPAAQVEGNPKTPGVRIDTDASAGLLSQGARQQEGLGQALGQLGGQVQEQYQQELNRQNALRVDDATNELQKTMQDLTAGPNGYTKLQGKDALAPDENGQSMVDQYMGHYQDAVSNISQGLNNDAQRQMMAQRSARMGVMFRQDLMNHVSAQDQVYQKQVYAGTVDTALNGASLDWNKPDHLAMYQGAIKNAVSLANPGADPSYVEAVQQEKVSQMHSLVLANAMQSQNDQYAKDYFAAHASEMTPEARLQFEGQVKANGVALDGINTAQSIWQQVGPHGDSAPLELDKLDAAALKAFPNDPQRYQATVAQLRQLGAARDASVEQRTSANTNTLYKLFEGGTPPTALYARPEFLALPGKQQEAIRDDFTQQATRQDAALAQKNYSTYLQYVGDPDKLASMSPAAVQGLLPMLGPSLTRDLVEKQTAMQTAAGKVKADQYNDAFKNMASQMGIDPTVDLKANPLTAAKLGQLRIVVDQAVADAQATAKRPLTFQEISKIMQQEVATQVTINNGQFFGRHETLRAAELNPKQQDQVEVPESDAREIVGHLQKNGVPVNDENIRKLYLHKVLTRAGSLQ